MANCFSSCWYFLAYSVSQESMYGWRALSGDLWKEQGKILVNEKITRGQPRLTTSSSSSPKYQGQIPPFEQQFCHKWARRTYRASHLSQSFLKYFSKFIVCPQTPDEHDESFSILLKSLVFFLENRPDTRVCEVARCCRSVHNTMSANKIRNCLFCLVDLFQCYVKFPQKMHTARSIQPSLATNSRLKAILCALKAVNNTLVV